MKNKFHMKKLIVFLFALITFFSVRSQSCLPEGITFNTQAQIDNFPSNYPGCTQIEGDITIRDWENILNLDSLSVLHSIGGKLLIETSRSLTSLNGLNNLVSIGGDLKIMGLSALSSLTGLDNLVSIGGGLTISGNGNLASLTGLDNLVSIGGNLSIGSWVRDQWGGTFWVGNSSLTSLTGLEGLSSVGDLVIVGNDGLTCLTGLDNLISIRGNLTIGAMGSFPYGKYYVGNSSLTSLTGLDNLTFIEGNLKIYGNNSLKNLTGLETLDSIAGSLIIIGNFAISSLTGLENLDAGSITELMVINNPSLSTCNVQSVCNYLANPPGSISIYGNAIGCNDPPEVANNCGIKLPCLPYGNYYFQTQADIDNFQNNYPNCTELEGNVTIGGSDISNLNGLSGLTYIGGQLQIQGDSLLSNLTGLDNLTSVGGVLSIGGNPTLISIAELTNLTSIGGGLSITGNNGLTSLKGLDNISAGSIVSIYIIDNPMLSNCAIKSICDYLVSPNSTIGYNAPGCNSPEEVEAACSAVSVNDLLPAGGFAIYPNPSSDLITIKTFESHENRFISIVNLKGQELIYCQVTEPVTAMDISSLPGGVYFIKVRSEKAVEVMKIIKK
jgi:hypothetical protein